MKALTLLDRRTDARQATSVTFAPLLTRRFTSATAPVLLVALAAPDRALHVGFVRRVLGRPNLPHGRFALLALLRSRCVASAVEERVVAEGGVRTRTRTGRRARGCRRRASRVTGEVLATGVARFAVTLSCR